jgi:hypothetical protein
MLSLISKSAVRRQVPDSRFVLVALAGGYLLWFDYGESVEVLAYTQSEVFDLARIFLTAT